MIHQCQRREGNLRLARLPVPQVHEASVRHALGQHVAAQGADRRACSAVRMVSREVGMAGLASSPT